MIQARDLWKFRVSTGAGNIGGIRDLQVDDRDWAVSDVVVSIGHGLAGRLVIIPPGAVLNVDVGRRAMAVAADAITAAPSITAHPPVSRQRRVALYQYLGVPLLVGELDRWDTAGKLHRRDPHVRSVRDLRHYEIEAGRAKAGRLEGWLIDVERWRVAYAVVKTRGGLRRKHVLVPATWLGSVSWDARVIRTDVPRDAIAYAPDYRPGQLAGTDSAVRL